MNRLLISFLLLSTTTFGQNWNIGLLSNWDDDSIPAAWTGSYSECWGYEAAGREYAFLASTQGTYFFDITDPYLPEQVAYFATRDTTTLVVNKDYATYDHYLYAVSDQGSNSLQIFDLQYLPDSVVLVYDEDVLSKRCHTIFVENDRLYMASNTRPNNTFGAMDIFSIADPLNPILLGTLSHPGFYSVHEVFVRNDTAYCANGTDGLWIYDVGNAAAPSLITILDNYTESGYNHSAWLTDDGNSMAFTDENHGKGVKIYDISDISDPQELVIFRSNMLQVPDPFSQDGSVAHNPYIVGNTLLISYYHDGVQAYDISDPANPVLKGFYDTHPQSQSYYSYNGCWGLYPFLPSGNIIASDITNGLFILDGSTVLNSVIPQPQVASLQLASNLVNENLQLLIKNPACSDLLVDVTDVTGRSVKNFRLTTAPGSATVDLSLSGMSSGLYVASVKCDEIHLVSKFVKMNP